MKTSHVVTVIWWGILASAAYFLNAEQEESDISALQWDVKAKIHNASGWRDMNYFFKEWIPSSQYSYAQNGQDSLVWLEKNPTLKMRIQGTSWYRDFLSGKLDRETFERNLLTANSIEQILLGDSEMLPKIQYQDWWKKYLRGDEVIPQM